MTAVRTAERAGAIVLLLGGSLIMGCGGGGGDGGGDDVGRIRQTMSQELSAVADGDGATACSLATSSGQASLARAIPGATCEQVIVVFSRKISPQIKDGLLNAQIKKVTVHGRTATVEDADITSTRGDLSGFLKPGSRPTVLTKQPDGTWKISG